MQHKDKHVSQSAARGLGYILAVHPSSSCSIIQDAQKEYIKMLPTTADSMIFQEQQLPSFLSSSKKNAADKTDVYLTNRKSIALFIETLGINK